MIAHRRARAATAAMREQRQVSPRLKISDFAVRREQTELHKMISTAARAKLRPGLVLILRGDGADRPIRVHHLVFAALSKVRADAEARLRLDGPREPIRPSFQVAHRNVQHCHLHAARDIHANGVRDDCVLGGQHAADRQAIAHVRVRHQRPRHRHRQQARLLHLHHRLVFETLAPLPIFYRFGARWRWRIEQGLCELAAQRVIHERRRIGQNSLHLLLQARPIAPAEDKLTNKIRRAPGRFTQRHAQPEKIFRIHDSS